jgi:hypothetical protein
MRKRSLRTRKWKLIEAIEQDIYGTPMVELFDIESDRNEQRNLADELPEIVRLLQSRLHAHIARRIADSGMPDPLIEQAGALRTWQPRFIQGKS